MCLKFELLRDGRSGAHSPEASYPSGPRPQFGETRKTRVYRCSLKSLKHTPIYSFNNLPMETASLNETANVNAEDVHHHTRILSEQMRRNSLLSEAILGNPARNYARE